ncbi:cytochrome P450 6j1-like isoform X2 [Agrilus planipennis]|uniref:Cytochrome P450 6j1-like isoform X2 n=1 Tax=Agrilus planipennis TaxID=224129 RepID=A0A7F5R4W5_AGRPL|nr:cytochrome P450 6j1-like isoform X2 [Agrilus planipennis]
MHSLLLLCITFYVIYKYLTRNFDYWEQKNVPYIRPKPFFGNICEVFFFRKQFAVQIAELYHQIQDRMVGIFILNQPFLIVKDPEIIKHVLVKDFDIFRNRSIYSNENIDSLSANFMFFAEANKWKILRTKASPIFTSGKLKNMYGTVGSIVKKFVNYLTEETVKTPILDAREVCARYSMDVVATTNFGVDAACLKDKNADFYLIGRRMFDFSYENTIRQAAYFVAPFFIKFAKLQTFDRHVYNYIKHLTTSQINFREENDNYRNGDIIDILVEFKRRKVINDMIFEVLRKYPPLSLLDRKCSTIYKIPNSDVIIEPGTPVYISVYGLHHDEKYFPNPEKFIPERFSKENERNISDYFYLPFGNGPRNCIGKRYSIIVLKLALVEILSEFEIKTCINTPLKIEYSPKSLTLVPNKNLYLKFKKSAIHF